MSDDFSPKSGRRGFFQASLEKLRAQSLEAVREFANVAREASDAFHDASALNTGSADVPYHRDRRRGGFGEAQRRRVRPPGALQEQEFLATCERCQACVEACPEDAIVSAGPDDGSDIEQTPILPLSSKACVFCEDHPCGNACPSGAISFMESLETVKIGVAVILNNLCLNTRGESCDDCVNVCPEGAEAIVMGEKSLPVIRPESCTGCGQCSIHCRAFPRAIHMHPL